MESRAPMPSAARGNTRRYAGLPPSRARRRLRACLAVTAAAVTALIAAACSSAGSQPQSAAATGSTVTSLGITIPGGPPKPQCAASPKFGCFTPAAPEPGTAIPPVNIAFEMRPAADNSFYVIPAAKGWFRDVGITTTPPPYGLKATDQNAIPLVLHNQVNVGAMFGGSVIDSLGSQSKLKMIMLTDVQQGLFILANPALHLKPVSYYQHRGMPFTAALRAALQPTEKQGAQLATTPELDTRPLINDAYATAGLPVPKLQLVGDPENLVLAGSNKIDFSVPIFASTNLALMQKGWTPLVGMKDLLTGVKTSVSSPVENLAFTVGTMANSDFINQNPNAILRFVSTEYRAIDAILADKGKQGGLLALADSFINSYTGSSFTPSQLYQVYSRFDPLIPWSQNSMFYSDTSNAYYWKTAYAAYIGSDVKAKVIPGGFVPDDGIWAAQIYSTLSWYQQNTDKILLALSAKKLSATQQRYVTQAKQYYAWHDYLDSFRLARAAAK